MKYSKLKEYLNDPIRRVPCKGIVEWKYEIPSGIALVLTCEEGARQLIEGVVETITEETRCLLINTYCENYYNLREKSDVELPIEVYVQVEDDTTDTTDVDDRSHLAQHLSNTSENW